MNTEMALATPPRLAAQLEPCERETTERQLVEQARAGQAQACETLAEHHRRDAYLLALQLLGNRDDALDVAQDAMLRFFHTLHRFDAARPVRPWLLRIVRNRVHDLWRRRQRRRAESLDDALSSQLLEPVAGTEDPEAAAQRAELRRQLWRALARLPEAKREILVLRDFHDLSYAEIARVLGIPMGTVMSRLHAARQCLRQELQGDDHA